MGIENIEAVRGHALALAHREFTTMEESAKRLAPNLALLSPDEAAYAFRCIRVCIGDWIGSKIIETLKADGFEETVMAIRTNETNEVAKRLTREILNARGKL